MLTKLFPKLFIFVLSATTLATSTAAGLKIANNFHSAPPQVAGISVESITPSPVISTPTPLPGSVSFPPASRLASNPSPKPTSRPVVTTQPASFSPAVSAASPNCPPPPANLCLVTLFGQQFDVTPLRSSHSGGDIFVCGTDMTAKYQNQHGSNLSRMQAFAYRPVNCSPGSSTEGTSPSPSASNQSAAAAPVYHKIEDENDEDDQHQIPEVEDDQEEHKTEDEEDHPDESED